MAILKTISDAIVQSCEWLCSHLVPVGAGIKNVLADLPLSAVRVALALGFLALAIWCLRLSKDYVMEGAPHATWWNDPRRWAVLVLSVLIVLYLTL